MRVLKHFPLLMGLMMGAMIPFMFHAAPNAGWAFVLAHVGVIAVIAVAGLIAMRLTLRPKWLTTIASHRPNLRHMGMMGGTMGAGFGVVCLYCLSIGGTHV